MKKIEVVAAIIQEEGKILATQRGYGEFKGGWEFPGGKVEPGESMQEALVREIHEELAIFIDVGKHIKTVEYQYPSFFLTMHCFLCTIKSGTILLLEHDAAKWLKIEEFSSVNWLPADIEVLDQVKALL